VASLAYLTVIAVIRGGGMAGLVFGVLAALGIAAYADLGSTRKHLPLVGSPSRLVRAGGWLMLAAALFLAFLFTLPTPDPVTPPAARRAVSEHAVSNVASSAGSPRNGRSIGGSEANGGDSAERPASAPEQGPAAASASRATDRARATTPPTRRPTSRSTTRLTTHPTPTQPPRPAATRRLAPPVGGIDGPLPTAREGAAAPTAPSGSPLYAVIEVVDGDTIAILRDGRREPIRLIGIDSPETRDPRTVVECFGREASVRAKTLLVGQRVRIATDPTQDERDRYDRLLAYVWLEDGTFVNQAMVAEGFAYEYTYDAPYRYQAEFKAAQRLAMEASIGLWSPSTCGGDANQPASPAGAGATAGAPQALAPPAPTVPPVGGASTIVIVSVFENGITGKESDEHAVIGNVGSVPVNLTGWRLNAGHDGQDFVFPAFELQPGSTCRVYTNEVHADSCGGSFGSSSALWNNRGDCGHLFDAQGVEVSSWCYPR